MSRRSITAAILAFAFPGAGHFYLGRRPRAAIFCAVVLFLFVSGILLDGKLYTAEPGRLLTFLATLGTMGSGAIYFVARAFGPFGDVASITYEYGTTFMLTAGLMNLLLVFDAWDIGDNRKA